MKHDKITIDSEKILSIIATAERAVVNVKNERIREIAFERVLDHLLTNSALKVEPLLASSERKIASSKEVKRTAEASGPVGWLEDLLEENFFSKPRSLKDILQELNNRSHYLRPTDLTLPLQKLCHRKKLRRAKQDSEGGRKKVYHWSNW